MVTDQPHFLPPIRHAKTGTNTVADRRYTLTKANIISYLLARHVALDEKGNRCQCSLSCITLLLSPTRLHYQSNLAQKQPT